MKKFKRKKLMALLCVFSLSSASANVEKSHAWKGSNFKIITPVDISDDCLSMWEDGLTKIYNDLLKKLNSEKDNCRKNDNDFEIGILDTSSLEKNGRLVYSEKFKFSDVNSTLYSIWDKGLQLGDSRIEDFKKLDIVCGTINGFPIEKPSENLLESAFNEVGSMLRGGRNRNETINSMLENIIPGDFVCFTDSLGVLKENFIKILKLPSIKNAQNDKRYKFSGLLSSNFEFILYNNDKSKKRLSLIRSLNSSPDGIVVARCSIYDKITKSYSQIILSRECSDQINELKRKVILKHLDNVLKKNPGFTIEEVCSSLYATARLGTIHVTPLCSQTIAGYLPFNIFKRSEKKDKGNYYVPVNEVAYQIWLENQSFMKRSCGIAKIHAKNIAKLASVPLIISGSWKLNNLFYSYLFEKLSKGGMYTSEFLKSRNKLLNDPKKLKEAVSKMMKEGVIGLESTIESLTNLVIGRVAMSKIKDVFNKTHCQLITFIGPPGTGKSLLANKFSLALTGKPLPSWGYFTSSSVRPGVPVVDQFFDGNSELVKRLKACNGKTVLFFDEIDKYDSEELLEKFRDAIDSGTMEVTSKEKVLEVDGFSGNRTYERVKTEKINISGLIVIFGTNEKPECWGLPPDDPNDPAENLGRTVVKRDGSMTQRFLKFKFHSFKKPEYKKMFENAFKSIVKYSKDIFGFEIVCEDNLLDKLAEESYYRMQGGRSIAVILNEMAGAITAFDLKKDTEKYERGIFAKIKRFVKTKKPKVQKVKVKFNNDTHKFEIEQIFDDTIPEVPEENEEDNENEKDQEVNSRD